MKQILFLISTVLFFSSCEPEGMSKGDVQARLKNLQELGTVEYTLSKILAVDDKQWYSVGDRKVLMSMKADLKAGVDFSGIGIEKIDNSEKSIELKMPPAKVILLDIQPDKIKYELIHVSATRGNFTNEELNKIQILGEEDINSKLEELGILKEADKNAKLFITSWLKMMGFNKVIFSETPKNEKDV
tara:strand:+ start:143 stop:703 length:561 start_codon:yes stop_codon:yes gene_type:complete